MEKHEIPLPDENRSKSTLNSEHFDEENAIKNLEASDNPLSNLPRNGREGGFLAKTPSKVRTEDSLDVDPPPDGGFRAWTQAFLCHLVIFKSVCQLFVGFGCSWI